MACSLQFTVLLLLITAGNVLTTRGAFRLGAIGRGWQKLLSGDSPALVTDQQSCVVYQINND